MAINPSGAVPVPLQVFGSWVSEVSPDSVPENISPDNQDVVFAPGQVGSRPGLARVLPPFPAGGPNGFTPTIVYAKSFVMGTGDIKNLYLDSNGVLYVEDLTNNPGVLSVLLVSIPGSYARSITSFNREYIAISDGLHGADVPLQYDGTFLDRVTQDGPGAPPAVASVALPPVAMSNTTSRVDTISSTVNLALYNSALPNPTFGGILTIDPITSGGGPITGYSSIYVFLNAIDPSLASGQTVVIAGNSNAALNGTYVITTALYPGNQFIATAYNATVQTGAGGTASFAANTMTRAGNLVTVSTATAHNLKVGYQALITNVPAAVVGTSITSIVINNENLAGLATVTTSSPHGLAPGEYVTITGVLPTTVGGGITTAVRAGDTVTLTTATPHGLVPGVQIQVAGVADPTFDASFTIAIVPSPTQIVYSQVDTDSSSTGGTVAITWPIPDNTPTPTYFEVVAAPTPTTFQVQVTYSDGSWTTGSVGFAWDGTFYVTSIQSPFIFTYQQYGPNATSNAVGTVTPYGQAAPGVHLMQVLFLTRQGYVTAPSPPVSFIANGGQYVSVSNIPIGPNNIVARILAFTGAQPNVPGELPPFFYIPVPAQLEGQTVSTATQVNDNTTTSAFLDFSDNTLYAALGISIPGNTLANQIVLDGALGFGAYESRLLTWGQRNTVQNFLNMGFDGGYLPSSPTIPTGWTPIGTGGVLGGGRFGGAWFITIGAPAGSYGKLSQPAYEDAYGDPIINSSLLYKIRVWLLPSTMVAGPNFFVTLSSASTGFSTSVIIPTAAMNAVAGSYVEGTFSAKTPITIPSDLILTIGGGSGGSASTLVVDELSIIPVQTPYTDQLAYGSYVNNPEGMDGVSGQFGPQDDTNKLMDMSILRGTLYLLTQAPSGRLHETTGNDTSEPVGWPINEVAANCGTLSAFGLTHSQADDTAASGGDDWMAWPSEGGAMITGGKTPEKIMQEIQPNWNDPGDPDSTVQINFAAAHTIWGLNDPVQRLLMFGLPIGSATAPNQIYPLNYRHLNTAEMIANSPPFHPSFAGKLIATDNARKWTHWFMTMNGAARMYRTPGQLSLALFGGNGQAPGAAPGYGNVYLLNPTHTTDDDYGNFSPYYTTYFFMDQEKAAALQLTLGRLMIAYWSIFVSGTGNLIVTPICDQLANPWPLTVTRTLSATPKFDMEGGGGYAQANRIALKISVSPGGSFSMSRLCAWFKNAKMVVRGSAQ